MSIHVKKGDTVEIITGDHKGSTGKVLHVYPKKGKVLVQGHNLVKKHVRPSGKNPQGGRITVEQPIDISNVLPVNPKTNKGSRVKIEFGSDGSKKRVTKDGVEIDVIRKAKK